MRVLAFICSTVLTLGALTACGASEDTSEAGGEVVLLTHDAWYLPDELIQQFEADTGYTLTVLTQGDAGTLTNKVSLTSGNPEGDVVYGIDNTFLGRAEAADAFDGEPAAIDHAGVCVNVDTTWFEAHGIPAPATFDDLADPAYQGLFVTESPATSSPGMAFLLATVAHFGEDGWADYWQRLLANGVKVDDDWDTAYQVDFTQGGGGGAYPVVLSYDTSPAFTVADGATTTASLPDTCFEQTEYAAVLRGAKNPEGAQAVVDWLRGEAVQSAMPENMYMLPEADVALPADWAAFVTQADDPLTLDPADIDANRDEWLDTWNALLG